MTELRTSPQIVDLSQVAKQPLDDLVRAMHAVRKHSETFYRDLCRELFEAVVGDAPRPSDDRISEIERFLYPGNFE